MKKLVYLIVFTLCLSGCAKSGGTISQNEILQQEQNVGGNNLVKCSYSTSEGRFAVGRGNERGVFCYIDYATATETPLCSAPSCAHNADGCTALLEENQYCSFIYTAGKNKLAATTSGNFHTDPPKLLIMDRDGSNRKELLVGKSGERFVDPLATDNENIYFRLERDGAETSNCYIYSVPLAGGEAKQLYEIQSRTANTIGVVGRDFYFYEYDWSDAENKPRPEVPENATQEEIDKIYEEYDAGITGKHFIYKVNIDTGETVQLLDWTSKQGSSGKALLMLEDTVYYGDAVTLGTIKADGTKVETPIKWSAPLNEKEEMTVIDAVIDTKAIVSVYNRTADIVVRYNVDLLSGEASPMNLTYITNGNVRPLTICGVSPDSLLVQYDCRMEDAVEIAPDGTPVSFFKVTNSYAMISYNDFFENKPNYKQIDTIFTADIYGY